MENGIEISNAEPIKHSMLLNVLINKIKPIDFKKHVFKQAENINAEIKKLEAKYKNAGDINEADRFAIEEEIKSLKAVLQNLKLKQKHYVILSIEEILTLARTNNWNICRNNDFIYLYNGEYWSLLDKSELQTFLGESSEKLGVEKFDARFFQFREMLFKQFIASANLPKPEPPPRTTYINLKNGTFEITPETWRLRPFNSADFLTYQLPFEYNDVATAPKFEAFMDKVLPDKESQNVLAEFLGYVFIQPDVLKLEKMLFLYGSGANGKSVFFDIVNALLGPENISSYSLENLTDDTGYSRAKIGNKLVNYASEISGKVNPSIFKQLASGEPVGARLPYGQPFTLSSYAKLIFNGNVLPNDVEHTHAFFRRFLIIPFEVTIAEAEQNKNLASEIITSELPGVLNWVLAGLRRLLNQEAFSKCDAADNFLSDYKKKTDTVQLFLEDNNYVLDLVNHVPLKDLYSEYRSYCQDNGNRPLAKKTFSERLKAIGCHSHRYNTGWVVFLKKEYLF
jgi:putative DNA primase/helicase